MDTNLANIDVDFSLEIIENEISELKSYIKESIKQGEQAHRVEENILKIILEIGYKSLGIFLDTQCSLENATGILLEDKNQIKRIEQCKRKYRSVFGNYEIARNVYGSRKKQKYKCIPADARMNLPENDYSYLLQDWIQSMVVEMPFRGAQNILKKMVGISVPVESMQTMNKNMAKTVQPFTQAKSMPEKNEEGELLIASADCKGVPICHKRDERKICEHKNKKGPKKDRKRMATVGAVYTINRNLRTAEEIVESLFREPTQVELTKIEKPKPQGKHVRAALSVKDENATDSIFHWMAEHVSKRQSSQCEIVLMMDGQQSLWKAGELHLHEIKRIEILDLLHVTPRIWDISQLLYNNEDERIQFVKSRVLKTLKGQVTRVVRGIRQIATKQKLSKAKRKKLETACKFLVKNRFRMQYHQYLEKGLPIATGVIEGACRHFVKDRMERAGMKWTMLGAQAMLDLRSTFLNRDWDTFCQFRIKQEQNRLYPYRNIFVNILKSGVV